MKYTSCKVCGGRIYEENKTHELVKCSSCKLSFYGSDFADIDIAGYYKTVYETEYTNFNNAEKHLQQGRQVRIGYDKGQVMKQVLKHNPKRVGEIGAGIGLIAHYLQEKGINYAGFEPVAHIAQSGANRGLNIIQADFTVLEKHPQEFDALLAFEVMEHLDSLADCMKLLHAALKPGGRFGFTVPNYDKRLIYTERGDKLYQSGPPLHVNFFTKESIEKVAALFNFKVEYLAIRSFPEPQSTKKKFLWLLSKVLLGRFHGSTIYCVLKKD